MIRKLTTAEMNRLSPDEVRTANKVPLIVVLENIRRHQRGEPLVGLIDRDRGY